MNPVSIKGVSALLAAFLVLSCGEEQNKSRSREISKADQVWHYSVIEAMRRGIYEGTYAGADPISGSDTTALAILMKTRPQYKAKGIAGTMVGFFTPALMSNIDLSPFHFHFISSDKKFAGHLIAGTIKNAEVAVYLDEKSGYEIELLHQNNRFKTVQFEGVNGAASY